MATSYGFAPGGTTFEKAAADYIKRRLNHVLLEKNSDTPAKPLATLREFVTELSGAQVNRPISDLMIGSHGSSIGAMSLALDAKITADSYEQVDSIATAGTLAIPSDVIEPRPLVHELLFPCRVRVVGCWIGMFRPYLKRLKEALGGNVEMVAAHREDAFYTKSEGPIIKGSLRYMLYDFNIYSVTQFATRTDVIDAFDARGFKFIGHLDIPRKFWEDTVPKDFNAVGTPKISFKVRVTPKVEGLSTITLRGKYDRDTEHVGPFTTTEPNQPAENAPIAERRAFILAKLPNLATYRPEHPLPMFVRAGYSTLGEFVDGHDWIHDPTAANSWQGIREHYHLAVPIWDPRNDRKDLIYDYISANGAIQDIRLHDHDFDFFTVE